MKSYSFLILLSTFSFFFGACNNSKNDASQASEKLIKEARYVISTPERYKRMFSPELFELNNKATLLTYGRDKEKCKSALLLLEEALAIDSAFFYAYVTKAHIYTILGDYIQAISLYEKVAQDIKVVDIEVYSSIAKLYEKIGQKEIAEEYYNKAISFYAWLYEEIGSLCHLVLKAHFTFILNPDKGLRQIDSLIALYPEVWELELDRLHRFENYDHQKELDNL